MKPKSKVPRFPLDIRHSRLLPVVISPFILTNSLAANVTLNASNAAGASSFASATRWSNAAAPSAGNDYFVTTARTLRTVADSGSATFAGGSLTLGDNTTAGILILKNQASGAVVTINSLTLNNGEIQAGATSTGAVDTIAIGGSGINLANSTAANRYSGTTTIGVSAGAGVLQVAANGALGSGSIVFDSTGNGSSARLELKGGIALSNAISMSARNNTSAGIKNISGNNTLSGAVTLGTGGTNSNYTIESDAGLLTLSGNITPPGSSTRSIFLTGSGTWNYGLFDHLGSPLADDSTITLGTNTWLFNYNDLTGGPNFSADQAGATGFVTMTVIPEPAAAMLGSLGLLALLRRRGTGGNPI